VLRVRRALRHAFTILSALSLLLCVGAVVLKLGIAAMREGSFAWDGSLFHIGYRDVIVFWVPVNYWLLAAIAAVLPVWWAVSRRSRLRTGGGRDRARRQLRRGRTICSFVSLVLALGVAALSVRSYSIAERANFYGDSKWVGLISARGSLSIQYVSPAVVAPDANVFLWNRWHTSEVRNIVPHLSVLAPVTYKSAAYRGKAAVFAVSYWLIVLILLTPPAVTIFPATRRAIRRFQQWRLPAPGLCVVCGYDLRASPDRCPECGTLVQNRA
jgi:hypothetical protein